MLKGKKILLGISGSIAAYKAAFLTRLLVKVGAEVKVLMTPSAADFISPLTLSTLSKNPVYSDVSNGEAWHNHVELGLWADAMIIAPATANTLARMANGFCDNMLLAVYLSSRCPVFFAPAMDLDMWAHPATQHNVEKLLSYGHHMMDVGDGELASGLVGKGRMAEPEDIVQRLSRFFEQQGPQPLKGRKVILTSGPSIEAIDPVRFISNHSTGKMGTAIADTFAALGAEVVLISGRVQVKATHPAVKTIAVLSAEEMYQAAMQYFPDADVAVLAAAVADYTPVHTATEKIKKKAGDELALQLKRTKDIAKALGQQKKSHQCIVGFAMETQNFLENAQRKLTSKNMNFIVLNSLREKGAGFGHDTNKVTFLFDNGQVEALELKSKKEVAVDIADRVIQILKEFD